MSIVIVKRSQRVAGPALPTGELELAEPPVLGEPASLDFSSAMVYLPMGLGSAAMVMMFSVAGSTPTVYMMSGMMGVSMVSMSVTQLGRQGMERKRKMRAERRDYLRYLTQLRGQARAAADEQPRLGGPGDHVRARRSRPREPAAVRAAAARTSSSRSADDGRGGDRRRLERHRDEAGVG